VAARRRAPRSPERHDVVSAAHLEKYLKTTGRAIEAVKVAPPARSHHRRLAEDFLEMAKAYAGDARHFKDKGDFVNALSCINYAHGWLDAGARLGLFDVGGDDQLFTLAE
jgi:hypothetical protein